MKQSKLFVSSNEENSEIFQLGIVFEIAQFVFIPSDSLPAKSSIALF